MRRSQVLIDQYLQAQDPVADGARLRASAAASAARPIVAADTPTDGASRALGRRSLRRHILLPAGAVVVAAIAIVLVGVRPSNGPVPARFLSPEQAVAAAAAGLERDGILEWTDVQGAARTNLSRQGTRTIRWIDLKTGDGSSAQFDQAPGPDGEVRSLNAFTWQVGRSSWLDEGERSKATSKRVVRRTVVDRPPPENANHWTPVKRLQRTLDRALRGDLPFRAAGRVDGVPVVVITDDRRGWITRSWITRERVPRLIKSAHTSPCPTIEGVAMNCSQTSDDGSRRGGQTGLSRTLTWTIHPRTPQFVAKVSAPRFDPARYVVVTERRR